MSAHDLSSVLSLKVQSLPADDSFVHAEFEHPQLTGEHPYGARRLIDTSATFDTEALIPDGTTTRRCFDFKGGRTILATSVQHAVHIHHTYLTAVDIHVSGPTMDAVRSVLAQIQSRIPASERSENILGIQVWYSGSSGPTWTQKDIRVPDWNEIRRNYPQPTAKPLEDLVRTVRPVGSGKLILWHGEPGTGKTTALRALVRSWRDWCSTHYIADPEQMFASTEYLLKVVGHSNVDPHMAKWRLLIAEDSDEFLRASARREAGAALGRLLNLSDGILGQGSNTLILLTTNERLDRLHPALVRPGRCLAQVEFNRFSPVEAAKWVAAGVTEPVGPITLAEMIELSEGKTRISNGIAPATNVGAYL